MKKFLYKITLLITTFTIFNMVLLFAVPKNKNEYLCAYNQKIHLLEATPHPQMIFIGGSNVAFSLDSKTIEDSLGYHVVNFGLHGGIGIRYIFEDALQYIKNGDVVVLQFEYANFYNNGNGERETFPLFMVSTNWRNINKLNVGQWITLIHGIPQYSIKSLKTIGKFLTHGCWYPTKKSQFVYAADGFNKYGDEISHFNYPNQKYKQTTTKNQKEEVDTEFINWLNKTIESYEQAGATVIMLPPVCIKSFFNQYYDDNINVALTAIHHPYIVPPSSVALDDNYMFNTEYHMSREGCALNTQNIIHSLSFLKR